MDSLRIDMNLLAEYMHKPSIFQEGKKQEAFWDNEYISKQMLDAHLNPDWDAASRKTETIESSCKWIIELLDLSNNDKILDLGCGPGLYSSRLGEKGLQVTGLDYSKRSINYAKEEARRRNLHIKYEYMNYLDMEYRNEFNLAMMIFCDFGVLSEEDSKALLRKIHRALKDNGYFIFDVWTTSNAELTATFRDWSVNKDGGFWRPDSYVELVDKSYYDSENVSLRQHIIIDKDNVNIYNLWERCYTVDSITKLLNESGFEVVDVYSDLTGVAYAEHSNTLGVIAKKK